MRRFLLPAVAAALVSCGGGGTDVSLAFDTQSLFARSIRSLVVSVYGELDQSGAAISCERMVESWDDRSGFTLVTAQPVDLETGAQTAAVAFEQLPLGTHYFFVEGYEEPGAAGPVSLVGCGRGFIEAGAKPTIPVALQEPPPSA